MSQFSIVGSIYPRDTVRHICVQFLTLIFLVMFCPYIIMRRFRTTGFCAAFWCAPCTSYVLRKRALYNDMSRYLCCAGFLPCSGQCGEERCPEFCLGTEVLCCFANSVQATRFLLQDEFNIQTTQCDNCIIAFMICLQQAACIFSIVAALAGSDEIEAASQILTLASDAVYCSVCACMQTQHKVELDKRDGVYGDAPMRAPQPAVMSRFDQRIPPAVGYPPAFVAPATYPPNYAPHPATYPPNIGAPSAQHAPSYGAPSAPYPPAYQGGPGRSSAGPDYIPHGYPKVL